MNSSNYRFTLDMQSNQSQVSLPVRLGDTNRSLQIIITNGGTPFIMEDGCSAFLVGKKAYDESELVKQCEIKDKSVIYYEFTGETANVPGVVDCEIRLYDKDGKPITSPRFILVVDERAIYDEELLSRYEGTPLDYILGSEQARQFAEGDRLLAEVDRVNSEKARKEAETARDSAEFLRNGAESTRQKNEAMRSNAESAREIAEAEREQASATMSAMFNIIVGKNGAHDVPSLDDVPNYIFNNLDSFAEGDVIIVDDNDFDLVCMGKATDEEMDTIGYYVQSDILFGGITIEAGGTYIFVNGIARKFLATTEKFKLPIGQEELNAHNESETSHADIREEIREIDSGLTHYVDSQLGGLSQYCMDNYATKEKLNAKQDNLEIGKNLDHGPTKDSMNPVTSGGVYGRFESYTDDLSLIFATKEELADERNSVNTNTSNAIKGTATGETIRANDVSPMEHTVKCKVKSKNLFNILDNYNGYGHTYADGTLSVLGQYTNKYILLEDGKTYTFSCQSTRTGSTGGGVFLRAYTEDKVAYVNLGSEINTLSPTLTATLPKGYPYLRITFYGYYATDDTDIGDATYTELMLEEGSVNTGYVPYVNSTNVTVSRFGKNLLDLSRATFTSATYNKNVNGITCKINNSYYSGVRVDYLNDFLLANKGKTLTFSIAEAIDDVLITLLIYGTRTSGKTNQEGSTTGEREISFAISDEFTAITGLEVRVNRKTEAFTDTTTVVRNMQVEVRDTASDFEVYKEATTHTPSTDGTVVGIKSISPTMTLFTDTANVVIEIGYNQDINVLNKKLAEALDAILAIQKTLIGGTSQ